MKNIKLTIATVCLALSLLACSTKIDKTALRSSSEIPETAKTNLFKAEFDPSLPTYILVLKPVYFKTSMSETEYQSESNYKSQGEEKIKLAAELTTENQAANTAPNQDNSNNSTNDKNSYQVGGDAKTNLDRKAGNTFNSKTTQSVYGDILTAQKITLQLASALSGVKNFKLVDYKFYEKTLEPGSAKSITVTENQRGPFLISAAMTEYLEVAESDKSETNLLTLYKSKGEVKTGIVGIDVSIEDPQTGEIIAAFPIKTKFSSEEKKRSVGLITPIAESKSFAQSALGQALREALTEATKQTHQSLLN